MAGETRRQRRDARRSAGGAKREPAREPVETGGGPAAAAAAPHVQAPRRGGFLRESVGELKKVEWPNRPQVIQGTIVVLIACAIVGAYLWGVDQVLRPFVRDVLLGQ
ncbi:MAG: preprotein translocase subunit SecE [Thermoleophilia bacterium]|nr:preprotein translocase subunit SecE [Thermoleophilia bacterium]MDH4344719.1 preprotein translocase subunit SecE [Thermoleophilia bacterium]MDH5333041.1 preprotein translocase subunit SecE [Thermoleophilia bacterium]